MRGWLLDIYPDYKDNSIVYWIKTRKGAHKIVERSFVPKIFAHSSRDDMDELEKALPILDAVANVQREMKSIWLGEESREVLGIGIRKFSRVEDVAHTIDNRGKYNKYSLFNVDLRFSQRFFHEKDIFPLGLMELRPKPVMLDDRFALDYEKPPLTNTELHVSVVAKNRVPAMDDRLVSAKVGDATIDGDEERILNGIVDTLDALDPDIVCTEGGDLFDIPYLFNKAKQLGMDRLRLGRDDDDLNTDRRGKSYFTYGQIKYKPPSYKLRGRIHIDKASSFMYVESGLNGLIDLSRISSVPVQELARLSPGSAISAMEVNQALRDGCVVMWKKNLPEGFKTAQELILADRGGFIYEPVVGVHDHVLEVDFTSLYPNIMAKFNISPETIMCSCCPEPARRVPVLGYGICDRRYGLIPRVLKPVVDRRTRLKRRVRDGVGDTKDYKERVDILKWLLVTCLDGSTEISFTLDGRFGIGPIRDIIDKVAVGGCGEHRVKGSLNLFGLDRFQQPALKNAATAFRFESPEEMVELSIGRDNVVVTPDHPCYVFDGGAIVIRRADSLAEGDMLPRILPLYDPETRRGQHLSKARIDSINRIDAPGKYVYCFSVDGPMHGFALSNGILTHNCFGYTGYKNARFGRIECHEAINAYGREIMLQASEIAEAHGFEILHGIIDSLWLKGTGDPERFCEHVSGHIGIPLEPEGVYKWIVFLPDKANGVGVLNRYYGMFESGKLKLRGIELRRRDTPDIVRDMQTDILDQFSHADDADGLKRLVPAALGVVERYVDDVGSGTVPIKKLVLTKKVSKPLDGYTQLNDSVAALSQLSDEGIDVNPGECIGYVITASKSKDLDERVRAEILLTGREGYDASAYVELLLRAAETMLLPMGYGRAKLRKTLLC